MDTAEKLIGWLSLIETTLAKPQDRTQIGEWLDAAEALSDGFDIEDELLDLILDGYQLEYEQTLALQFNQTSLVPIEKLDALCARQQIEQRTPAWYKQMGTILSASELGNLFSGLKLRAQLIMSKVNPVTRPPKALALSSSLMNAMDWGVRFEPVVKQIYNYKYGTTIRELGRLLLEEDPRCSASPDGLIYDCPGNLRSGRLIEIKCPVTRKPDGKVPKDYYMQMQMQLRVTGLTVCDFVEAVFDSPYSAPLSRPESPQVHGTILLIQLGDGTMRYEYGPVQEMEDTTTFTVPLQEDEHLLETIPWSLTGWHEQQVILSDAWWATAKPVMDAFWVDVDKARLDPSFLDEHLKKKEKPEEACLIRLATAEATAEATNDSGSLIAEATNDSGTLIAEATNDRPCSEEPSTETPL
jgi:YqaJ-like viral recombinase domain